VGGAFECASNEQWLDTETLTGFVHEESEVDPEAGRVGRLSQDHDFKKYEKQ